MESITSVLPIQSAMQVKSSSTAYSIQNNSFKNIFDNALKNLNDSQLKSEETLKNFLVGEVTDVHTVMISLEEAKLHMQLAVEVRNKLIEAYQEVSRMQV